jgi:putative ABC transport system permease protein
MMETLFQDLGYGFRLLIKRPGFTVVALIALALGIGANTAIFSVVNAVLLRQLPYRDPSKLVMVWENNRRRGRPQNVISPANFLDWRDQNNVFEDMAMFIDFRFNLSGVDDPEELPGQIAQVNLFDVLGVNAQLGHTFSPENSEQGRDNVVLLSHGLWQRRYGGDPDIVGKTIMLNGESNTIIGVMPAGFQLYVKQGSQTGKPVELWLPWTYNPRARIRAGRAWLSVARLKPEVTLAQAQTEMDSIAARFEEQYPEFDKGWGVTVVPLREQFVGDIKKALFVLLAAVGFVLLIACANVANLLLARAASRQREIAIRTALGAGRRRVIRQLLTESVLLSIIGGGAGLLLALWGTDLLLALSPRDLLGVDQVALDRRVLLFTALVSLITGVLFGLAPAIAASRTNLNETLKEGGRDSGGGGRSRRIRNAFVIAEVALALVLLVGSGLMIKSLWRLQSVDPGFNSSRLLTARLLLPNSKYNKDSQRIDFFKQLVERMQSQPGVRSATAIDALPFGGPGSATGFIISGRPAPAPGEVPTCDVRVVEPNYFDVMGIPFLAGRTFTEREATQVSRVVVVNKALADLYFETEGAIGQKIAIEMTDNPVPSEIVGIVGDAKYAGLDIDARPMAYWPHPELARSFMTLVVRTENDPMTLAGALRHEVQALDKDQPVADIKTMEQLLSSSIARTKFSATLLVVFAVVALVLAAVGIYGVMAYSVEQRTHEIGIRMALGAGRSDVVAMVVRQGMILAGAGVLIGLGAAWALTRFLASLLYQVSTTDTTSFLSISVALAIVALVASLIPAYRATKVDPMVALRYE